MLAAALTIVLTLMLNTVAPASAAGFHAYSVAYYHGHAYALTGMLTVRQDVSISVSAGTTCTTPFTGTPVYVSEWVIFSTDLANFVELGTGHQCNGFTYRYWGYSSASNWYPYGTQTVTPDSNTHYFDIHRLSSGGTAWWYWLIDGVQKSTLGWNQAGVWDEVGLESYDQNATAPVHTYDQLQFTFAEGPWYYFDSANTTSGVNTGVCGAWTTFPTTWRASEGVSC